MTIKKRPKAGAAAAAKKKTATASISRSNRPAVKVKDSVSKKSKVEKRPLVIKPAPKSLSREMLVIRDRLIHLLKQMRGDIDREVRGASERDLAHINDSSDMASDAAEGDLSLRIAESETVQASEVERAIEKVDTGTYGLCEICNQAIGADRLRFLPYVTMCIRCQGLAEIKRREEGEELEDLAETTEAESENN